jgi:hypothetical protein
VGRYALRVSSCGESRPTSAGGVPSPSRGSIHTKMHPLTTTAVHFTGKHAQHSRMPPTPSTCSLVHLNSQLHWGRKGGAQDMGNTPLPPSSQLPLSKRRTPPTSRVFLEEHRKKNTRGQHKHESRGRRGRRRRRGLRREKHSR